MVTEKNIPQNQSSYAIITETVAEAVVEGSHYVKNTVSPCHFTSSSSDSSLPKEKQHEKLSAVATLWRERPPTSYCIKFQSFATLLKLVKDGKYESRPFTIGGYNWTFLIYPNGNKKDGANGYVSLYARIDNLTLFSDPKDVYAEVKFFVYNRVYDKYDTYQVTVLKVYPNGDGYGKGNSLSLYLLSESNENAYVRAKLRVLDQIRSNHVEKLVDGWPNATANNNGWGYEKFVSLADLKDAAKGLVVDDAIKVEVEFTGFSKTDSTLDVFY
ncbi:unnamed protein product [Arabidopsis arenosa]|uniref:MATH domain-containing protein n=1 Tax=Arabidopsis arenosa TaxID=38785 RepID=A0A8S2A761_ARAAE|nr:unnamed protein product [Arabidopsis arenosa]